MFNYEFSARSFDEQGWSDGSPALVSFVGNFSPVIDSVVIGFYDQVSHGFRRALSDTLYIGWTGAPQQSRGDTMNPYSVESIGEAVVKSYRFNIQARGHDDRRDPPGSGIKAWMYLIHDPDADYPYEGMNEWNFDNPINQFAQEVVIKIQASSGEDIVHNPPAYLGAQSIRVTARDMGNDETSLEGIRGISPQFDPQGHQIPCNCWILNEYFFGDYGRTHARTLPLYLKLVR